ncbi:Predicted arabinose efflux permease, MFS family [Solimonas aquatica]|uniref:Predicted arabinose efflux permease, MFS family n=1 Tax=Solimonas aquatica TaxID=489703 RepID=A0A1H9CU82_9GAMM|nr:MFS transporter [Solimonas aquatica]SEQ04734.1 Predicted arabinose efflux permease, MFS family [Solimonas aquatica]
MSARHSHPPRAFEALRHPGFRRFLAINSLAMAADNVEHVISYWVLFQKFHSPALGGFAVIAHWVPYLLFSVWSGALADRFDPRRLIQIGMLIFIAVSLSWGLLFAFDVLQIWHAVVLLILHGIAGVFWTTPSQVLLHDVVQPAQLPSAVRLNATGRYLGMLCGPALGSGLLLLLGPAKGIFVNALIYLPALLWLWHAPYGPKFRSGAVARRAVRGLADILSTAREIVAHPVILAMTLLAGGAAFLIGNAYQAQMPGFAEDLGHGHAGLAYSALLGADAFGALCAGLLLELRGLLPPRARTALLLATLWCCGLIVFALMPSYPLALITLFVVGFLELSFNSMAQALVQLAAPEAIRGRVLGLYAMAAMGMRSFSGVSIGLLGAAIGVHQSLAGSALALLALVLSLLAFTLRGRQA